MANINNIQKLYLTDTARSTGIIAGYIWSIRDPKYYIEYPLSSSFECAIYCCICGFIAEGVSEILPKEVKPVLPILLLSSSTWHVAKLLYRLKYRS